jgi:hypothetical protein
MYPDQFEPLVECLEVCARRMNVEQFKAEEGLALTLTGYTDRFLSPDTVRDVVCDMDIALFRIAFGER